MTATSVSRPATFSVTILGSGTCTPSVKRQPAGYLLRTGTFRYLVDSGSGTIGRLMRQGVSVLDLDAFFYTHLHLDHTGDLFPILFSIRNSYGQTRRNDVRIFGPPGFKRFYGQLAIVYGRWIVSNKYNIEVNELRETRDGDGYPIGNLVVETVKMKHTHTSVGYRFHDGSNRVIAFTGDADTSPGLISLLKNADLALADCSMPDELKIDGHLSPTPLAQACEQAHCKKLILTHLYPPADEHDLEKEVRRNFSGEVITAADGATYDA